VLDGGVAHCHIACDDGDEEEVHKDEAIELPLAANGFTSFTCIINNNACVFTV
jgi:hypothetical protein